MLNLESQLSLDQDKDKLAHLFKPSSQSPFKPLKSGAMSKEGSGQYYNTTPTLNSIALPSFNMNE